MGYKNSGNDGVPNKVCTIPKSALYFVGLLIGFIIGSMLENIPIGIAIGVAFGVGFAEVSNNPAMEAENCKERLKRFLVALATLILVIIYSFIN